MLRLAALALSALALAAVLGVSANAQSPQTRRVVVAIVDTGVSPSKWLGSRRLAGWDFVDNDADPSDQNGHGTELASIVARGCAKCDILPVRVLGRGGIGPVSLAVQGIQWAASHGASVINLSISTPYDNPDLTAAIEGAVGQGITVVVAAGNAGQSVGYPGSTAVDAIAVGSVDSSGQRAPWSNYGPWVGVTAPGTLSARSLTGRVVSAQGTSASAAYVAGAAGALLSCGPLDPASVKEQLRQSLSGGC
jgi:thermitase